MKTILKAIAFKLHEPAKKLGSLTSSLTYKLALRMDLEYKAGKIAQSIPNAFVGFSDVQEELFQCLPPPSCKVNKEFPAWISNRALEDLRYSKDPKTSKEEGFAVVLEDFNKKITIPSSEFNNKLEPFREHMSELVNSILRDPKSLEKLDLCKEEALALADIFIVLSDEALIAVNIFTRKVEGGTLVGFDEPISNQILKHVSKLFKDLATKLPSRDNEKKTRTKRK